MTRILMICLTAALLASTAGAQNLVIANARILDGTGGVIERGAVTIEAGRIRAVASGDAAMGAATWIDAQGMTVMPGFIDTHRHVISGADSQADLAAWLAEQAPARMREFLQAGFTTIMSAGDPTAGILELKGRLEAAEFPGPRLLVSGDRIRPATAARVRECRADDFCRANRSLFSSTAEARELVRELAGAGVDAVKIRLDPDDPTGLDEEAAAVVAAEAGRQNVPSIAHATQVPNMIAALNAGITRLVHTPHTGTLMGTGGASMVVERNVPVSSTLGVWVPIFGAQNEPLWRNGAPFPPPGVARAGQGPVNARYLWDAGAVLAFGTDTGFHPAESLMHELRPLRLLFSPRDIVAMMTSNAAAWLGLEHDLGALRPGMVADLVLIDGDPLADTDALANVELVVKGGEIVVINAR